ncbi:UBN2_3 domain-containing protein [Cephalotus follicularis]|uniref:UBN2_3 domain-containing protein n=1 Tax=Cephalotus follicularis TaxID=3775 RepID=A0A1Q3CK30_CEPFO|nr:UBN2_3 domain-containing protein [Cephalotus follicularis]
MYISGKDKLGYINGDLPPPSPTDPGFRKWKTEDSTIRGWLINSLDPSLISNFIRRVDMSCTFIRLICYYIRLISYLFSFLNCNSIVGGNHVIRYASSCIN